MRRPRAALSLALGLFLLLVSNSRVEAQRTPPPPAPRAIEFPDTLGAAFNIADSASAHGSPSDFDFLVGEWQFRFQVRRPDGVFVQPFTGKWSAKKKATRNAFIEDRWRPDIVPDGTEEGTFTYRAFSPARHLWIMQGVDTGEGRWAPGLIWSDADNRYAIQNYGPFIMRIRYFAITPDSFKWRADMSIDHGKTWLLDAWTMQATRFVK